MVSWYIHTQNSIAWMSHLTNLLYDWTLHFCVYRCINAWPNDAQLEWMPKAFMKKLCGIRPCVYTLINTKKEEFNRYNFNLWFKKCSNISWSCLNDLFETFVIFINEHLDVQWVYEYLDLDLWMEPTWPPLWFVHFDLQTWATQPYGMTLIKTRPVIPIIFLSVFVWDLKLCKKLLW